MSDSKASRPRSSSITTFDSLVNKKPLLFRLHENSHISPTLFDAEKKVLQASRHNPKYKNSNEEHPFMPKAPPALASPTPDESDELEVHITSWIKGVKKPSKYISLTLDISYVFFEWRRRRSERHGRTNLPPDDFIIIVLESSKLSGVARRAIEVLREDQELAYNFARCPDEVIVTECIESPAILGYMKMSQLESFIPSWWQKPLASILRSKENKNESSGEKGNEVKTSMFRAFVNKMTHPDEDDCIRGSLSFALALLAPIMVQGVQHRIDNGSVVIL
jgi:hypothetical protein